MLFLPTSISFIFTLFYVMICVSKKVVTILDLLIDIAIQIIGELIIEGSFEVVNNKKIPLPYRIMAGIVVSVVVLTITIVFCYVIGSIIIVLNRNNLQILSLLLIVICLSGLTFVIYRYLKKDYLRQKKIDA